MGKKGKKQKGKDHPGRAISKARKKTPLASNVVFGKVATVEHADFQSKVELSPMQELLETAALDHERFSSQRGKVMVLRGNSETENVVPRRGLFNANIPIPRRPHWEYEMDPLELDAKEKEMFLEWRRQLSKLEEQEGVVLTPFEKNLQIWRQLWRVVERSDILVQIVDARDPLFYFCPDLMKYCEEFVPPKSGVLLLNKADLLTPLQRMNWAHYFSKKGTSVLFFSALQSIMPGKEGEEKSQEIAGILNATELICALSRHYYSCEPEVGTEKLKPRFVVGMVGYPNVGKSSTINALCGSKRVSVTATPGHTKWFQTINVAEEMTLCDCPGLVFPNTCSSKAHMLLNGVLSVDTMSDPLPAIQLVCTRLSIPTIYAFYNLPDNSAAEKETATLSHLGPAERLLDTFARTRGFFTGSGSGRTDHYRPGRTILKDYVAGRLLFCCDPPMEDVDRLTGENERHETQSGCPEGLT